MNGLEKMDFDSCNSFRTIASNLGHLFDHKVRKKVIEKDVPERLVRKYNFDRAIIATNQELLEYFAEM